MKDSDLVIYGSFGFGNAGDEAVPEAVRDMLRALGHDATVHVVARFLRTDLAHVIGMGPQDAGRREQLRGLPLLVSGGGIIEPHCNAGLARAAPVIRHAPRGKATVFGASVEPGVAFDLRARWRLGRLLRRMGTVYTRDRLSERTLNGLMPWVRTETVGDLVLWMRPARTAAVAALQLPARYIACVMAPRWSSDPQWTDWIAAELAAAARHMNAAVVFVPMSTLHDDDRNEHARVAHRMLELHPDMETHQIDRALEPREVCEVIARSALTVSMRLHGCVMAYAQRTPFVCIAYHPKLLGFSETVGCLESSLPFVRPRRQSTGAYGYHFADLELKPGDLCVAMDMAVERQAHARLEELKGKSLAVLKQLLAEG